MRRQGQLEEQSLRPLVLAGRLQGIDIAGHTVGVGWGVGREACRSRGMSGLDPDKLHCLSE